MTTPESLPERLEREADNAMSDGLEDYGLAMHEAAVIIRELEGIVKRLAEVEDAIEAPHRDDLVIISHGMVADARAALAETKGGA